MTYLGFKEVYNQPYAHTTLVSEILELRAQCDSTTLMCVGGAKLIEGILKVVACGNCLIITNITLSNRPILNGLAYWYLTPLLSFGFSPNALISQSQADTITSESNSRLSWHIDLGVGGWRLGSLTGMNLDTNYYKKIFLKYSNSLASTTRVTTLTTTVTAPTVVTSLLPFHLTYDILVSWGYTFKERHVDLSNLNIGSIESGLLGQFIYLEKLILRNNKILRLYPNTFKNLPYLNYLDFSYNRLTSMNKGDFDGAPNLETFLANNNNLQQIGLDTFHVMTKITTYSFANNPVTQYYSLILSNGVLTTTIIGTLG